MARYGQREHSPKAVSGSAPAGPLAGQVFEVYTRPADGSLHGRRCSLVSRTATSETVTLGAGPDLDGLGWPEGLHCGPDLGYDVAAGQKPFSMPSIGGASAVRADDGEELVHLGDGRAYLRADVTDLDEYAREAVARSQARAEAEASAVIPRTSPGPDSAWNLDWKQAERILGTGVRHRYGRNKVAGHSPDYDALRAYAEQTEDILAATRQQVTGEVRAVGLALLRTGKLAESATAAACLMEYHHAYPGEQYRRVRDSANTVLEYMAAEGSGVRDGVPRRVQQALWNVVFTGGQQGLTFFWVSAVAWRPDDSDDVSTILAYLRGSTFDSLPVRNWYDRDVLFTAPGLRMLGRVTAAFRAELARIAGAASTMLVATPSYRYSEWSNSLETVVPSRTISTGSGKAFTLAAVPEHVYWASQIERYPLMEVTDASARDEVDRVATIVEHDPDVLRELDANGFTPGVAHRVAFRLGLPQPAATGPVHRGRW